MNDILSFLNLHNSLANYGSSRIQDEEYAKKYDISFTEKEFDDERIASFVVG